MSSVQKKTSFFSKESFSLSLFLFLLVASVFFLVSYFIIKKRVDDFDVQKKRYHVVLNHEYGYVDKGFSEQAVNGVCIVFKISQKNCNGKNPLFKEAIISFGYPGTMENPYLINQYVKNFVKSDKVNNFIMPGFTYTQFLCDFNRWYENNNVNIIAIGTFFSPKNLKCKVNDPKKWPKNLWQVSFKEQYAGYHAGLYAGAFALQNPSQFKDASTKAGKQIAFGAFGGLFIPAIINYVMGFKYGIQKINENRNLFLSKKNQNKIELIFNAFKIVGGFDERKFADKTKQIAKKFFLEKKVSVIMAIAVTLVNSTLVAALESNVKEGKKQNWVIGVDVDSGVTLLKESSESKEIKSQILTSAILKIDKVIAKIINEKIKKKISPTGWYIPGDDEKTVSHGEYATIPNRFKQKNPLWSKIKNNALDDFENVAGKELLKEFSSLAFAFLKKKVKIKLLDFLNNSLSQIGNDNLFWKNLMAEVNE